MTVSTSGWLTAYDATNWPAEDSLPPAGLYFLYNDANYAAPASAYTRFASEGHHVATICVYNTTVANEYDYEPGNQNNPVPWAKMMRSKYNYTGVIYCDYGHIQEILNQFSAAGINPPYFRLANWTGFPPASLGSYGAGTVGIQYTDQGDGGQVDISLVSPNYPVIGGVAPPTPPPTPAPASTYQYRASHNTSTPIAVDGWFGLGSWKALQYVLGVATDGVPGPVTVVALQNMLANYHGVPLARDGILTPGGNTVKSVQEKSGASPQDGYWGSGTSTAVQRALNVGNFWGSNP